MKTYNYIKALLACLLICGFSVLNITTSNAQCSWTGVIDFTAVAPTLGNSVTSGSMTSSHIYRITGMVAGATYRVSTCAGGSPTGDTQLSIYTAGGGTFMAYDDDFGPDCSSFLSSIDFTPGFSGDYDIVVSNYFCQSSGSVGSVTVSRFAAYDPCASIFTSNACGISNTSVIPSGSGSFNGGPFGTPGKELIYTFTPVTTGNYTITVTSNSFFYYTDFFYKPVSSGCSTTGWTFIQDIYNTGTSFGAAAMTGGTAYYIMLDEEFYTSGGTVTWQINCNLPPPVNDDCSSVVPVTLTNGVPVTFTGNTQGATASTDGAFYLPTVWHAFTLNSCASVTLDYCSTSPAFQDIWINLATSCPAFSFVTSFNYSTCSGGNYTITFPSLSAGTYWIPVLGNEPGYVTPGPYTLNVTAQACFDPCTAILPANACDVSNTSVIPAGTGSYSVGPFGTPGIEKIYTFTPTVSGNYHITVNSNSFFYYTDFFYKPVSGGCNSSGWTFIQDIYNTGTSFGFASLTGGTAYYIMLDEEFYTFGGTVNWTINCPLVPPANDNCANAIPVACGATVTGSTLAATQDAPNFNCGFLNGPDVWYSVTIPQTETVTLRLCGSSYDTELGVFSGTCGSLTQIACNDDFCGLQSGLNFTAPAGTYLIAVSGFFGSVGTYSLTVQSCIVPPPPPVNDACSSVTPVIITPGVNVTFTGTTLGATNSNAGDGIFNIGYPVVWHAFTLTSTCASLQVRYCGTPAGTLGNVFINLATGCPANGGFFNSGFENFTCGDGNYTMNYVNVPAGTYYIPVLGEYPGFNTPGPYTVTVVPCPPPPANDIPCGAFTVTCGNNASSYTNQNCTVDAGEPSPPASNCNDPLGQSWCPFEGGAEHSVWFSFAAPPGSGPGGSSVTIRIASGGSTGLPSFDSQAALWDPGVNGSCASYSGWTLVWANDDDDIDYISDGVYIFSSKMVIPAGTLVAGRTYFLQVDGYGGSTGRFKVIVNCPVAVPPVISCPPAAMICSNGASIGTPIVISSQAPVTFTNNAPAVYPLGTPTVVTWTGTDAYGQTSTCTQNVTRNEGPTIVSLQSATLNGGVAQSFPAPPTFLDIPVFTTTTTCDKVVNYNVVINGTPDPDEVVGGVTYSFSGATTGSGSGTGTGSTFGRLIPTGRTTVTINATNVCGSTSKQFRVTVTDNVAPVITPIQVAATNTNGGECSSLVQVTQPTLGNGLFDNCPNASLIFVSRSDNRTQFEPYYAGTTTVTWQATDASANVSTATQNVVVNNIKPVVTSLTSSAGSVIFTGQSTTFTTTFTDEDGGGTHTIKFYRDKNDASPSSIKTLAPSCTQSCNGVRSYTATSDPITYTASEVAEPKVEVLDGCNLAADQVPGVSTFQYLAIAVAGSQFTTGGGHFTLQPGTYPSAYAGLGVNIGNVVKLGNGNNYKGQLEMNVHLTNTTNWRVHTDNGSNQDITWDYLVVSGCTLATFKGAVLLNGVSGYKVLVQQADKNANPATSNFIRVKVTTNGGALIFDTQPGLTEALTAGNGGAAAIITALDGGSITVHPNNGCVSRMDDQSSDALLQNIPNPFTGETEIRFTVPEDGKYTLTVYDYLGQEVKTLFNAEATAGSLYSVTFDGSNLESGIYTYTLRSANTVETRRMNLMK